MKLQITLKSAYGRTLAYPACDKAEAICEMLRAKTLTRHALDCLKRAGFTIEAAGGLELADVQ